MASIIMQELADNIYHLDFWPPELEYFKACRCFGCMFQAFSSWCPGPDFCYWKLILYCLVCYLGQMMKHVVVVFSVQFRNEFDPLICQ